MSPLFFAPKKNALLSVAPIGGVTADAVLVAIALPKSMWSSDDVAVSSCSPVGLAIRLSSKWLPTPFVSYSICVQLMECRDLYSDTICCGSLKNTAIIEMLSLEELFFASSINWPAIGWTSPRMMPKQKMKWSELIRLSWRLSLFKLNVFGENVIDSCLRFS